MQLIPPLTASQQMDYDCTRRGCYRSKLPSWDRINDALPPKIRLTDIDGMVEVGGRFVFVEHKWAHGRTNDGDVPEGQRRALCALSRLPGVLVVILMSPTPDDALVVDVFARFYMGGKPCRIDGVYGDKFEPYYAAEVLRAITDHLRIAVPA